MRTPAFKQNRIESRRQFIKASCVSAVSCLTGPSLVEAAHQMASGQSSQPGVCLFSKPLHLLSYQELAEFCAELKLEGVDLTVRPEGHVLPERVEKDLPAAVRALRALGLQVPMITTGIVDADDAATERIIKTASELGIPFLKLGYFYYKHFQDIPNQLLLVQAKVRAIAELCRKYKVQAGFHNHSDAYVGAAMWDLWEIVKPLPHQWVGAYFDPAHATIEGGDAGWKIGMNLLLPRFKMLAVKDFRWQRQKPEDRSKAEFGPLGTGEVRWDEVFGLLKNSRFSGPISLHVEYTVAADNSKAERERMLKVVKADLGFLRKALQRAGLA